MNNLKRIREARGKNQDEVAAPLGVVKSTISMWEKAQELPKWAVPKLCETLPCTREELVGSSEPVPNHEAATGNVALKFVSDEELQKTLERISQQILQVRGPEREQLLRAQREVILEQERRPHPAGAQPEGAGEPAAQAGHGKLTPEQLQAIEELRRKAGAGQVENRKRGGSSK